MARVAEALKGLTNYLRAENTRLDAEFKEAKIDLSAEMIAKKFQELPPDATPQELQKLQFESIENAAALGGLQENLPLISGMYNSAHQTRSLIEQEKRDEAFAEGIEERLGIDVAGMRPADMLQLFQADISSRKDITSENLAGQTILETFNVKGDVTFKKMISPLGRQQKLDIEFGQQTRLTKMTSDFALRNALALQQNKFDLEANEKYGLTGVRQFKGMDFLRAQTTPEQGQLYEPKKGGGLFLLQDGGLVAYQGDVIPRKAPQSAEDIVDLIQKNRDLNQIQRFRLGTMLGASEQGRDMLSAILGRKVTKSEVIKTNKATGREELSGTIMTELELAFGRDDIQDRLTGLFGKDDLQGTQDEFQALGLFGASILGEQEFEKQQYAKIPKSKYSNITNVAEWNRGSALLSKFVTNPEQYSGIAGAVYNYVNRKLGREVNTPVSRSDVHSMDFDNQIYLNRQLSIYHKSNLGLEAKVPTLEDITTPRKLGKQEETVTPTDIGGTLQDKKEYMTTEEYNKLMTSKRQIPDWLANN